MIRHEVGASEKHCPRCDETKPVETGWAKSRSDRTGYNSMCKDCDKARNKAAGYVCQKAQGDAVILLRAAHKTVYDSLYRKERNQSWAQTQLTYAFPEEYRQYYVEAKKDLLERLREAA